jgi:hypothetical protein
MSRGLRRVAAGHASVLRSAAVRGRGAHLGCGSPSAVLRAGSVARQSVRLAATAAAFPPCGCGILVRRRGPACGGANTTPRKTPLLWVRPVLRRSTRPPPRHVGSRLCSGNVQAPSRPMRVAASLAVRWAMLEPYALKGARTVLRGGGGGNAASLPDPFEEDV